MKQLFNKYREIIMYLVFGVLTTVVGLGTYYAIMWAGDHVFHVPMEDKTAVPYLTVYISAQVIQWIAAVLFAFFTNRAWVFTDADRSKGTLGQQLLLFAGARVVSFLLDIAVTYGLALLLSIWIKEAFMLFGILEITADSIAKLVAAVLVVIANYVLSKLVVFRKNKK